MESNAPAHMAQNTHAPDDRECVSQSHRVFVLTKTMMRLPLGLLAMYSCNASSFSGPWTTLTSWVMVWAATGWACRGGYRYEPNQQKALIASMTGFSRVADEAMPLKVNPHRDFSNKQLYWLVQSKPAASRRALVSIHSTGGFTILVLPTYYFICMHLS